MATNYAAWEITPEEGFSGWDFEKQALHLLSWAILAANAHNAQPWEFVVHRGDRRIDVLLCQERVLANSDKRMRQAITSLGCLLFVFERVAAIYDTTIECQTNPTVGQDGDWRCATIEVGEVGDSPLGGAGLAELETIRRRKVNRSKYKPEPVSDAFLDEVNGLVFPGIKALVINDMATLLAISELQYMADRAVIALPGFRKDLASHLIAGTSDEPVGMPGTTYGLSDEVTEEIRMDMSKKGILNPQWAAGFAAADRDGIRSSRLMVVLVGDDDTPERWLAAGAAFQEIALVAVKHELAVAVNAALVESKALNNMLKMRLNNRKKPLSTFRVGYPTEDRPHSPRIPAAEITRFV